VEFLGLLVNGFETRQFPPGHLVPRLVLPHRPFFRFPLGAVLLGFPGVVLQFERPGAPPVLVILDHLIERIRRAAEVHAASAAGRRVVQHLGGDLLRVAGIRSVNVDGAGRHRRAPEREGAGGKKDARWLRKEGAHAIGRRLAPDPAEGKPCRVRSHCVALSRGESTGTDRGRAGCPLPAVWEPALG
jgi:hypothetical protein